MFPHPNTNCKIHGATTAPPAQTQGRGHHPRGRCPCQLGWWPCWPPMGRGTPWGYMGTPGSCHWPCGVGPHPSTPHLAAATSHKLKFHLLRPGRLRLRRERAAPVTPPAPTTRCAILLREQVPQPLPRPLGWPRLCHTTTGTALAWLHRGCLRGAGRSQRSGGVPASVTHQPLTLWAAPTAPWGPTPSAACPWRGHLQVHPNLHPATQPSG